MHVEFSSFFLSLWKEKCFDETGLVFVNKISLNDIHVFLSFSINYLPLTRVLPPWLLCIQCFALFGRNWLWKSKVSKRIHTRGPRALTVTWVSETLHWLLVRRAHISIYIQQWTRKAALYSLNTMMYIDRVEDNAYSLYGL